MAFSFGRRKGIFLSLDVSIALLVIFTAVMLSFAYFSQAETYGPSNLLTRGYLQDAASVMSNRGDFALPLVSKNRPDTTGISEVLAATPSSVCMQVEAYGVTVPEGLEAYWKLDEDTGATTTADSSGNGVVGVINGTVYFSQPSRTGVAILFDGSTGIVSANVPALSGAYTFTEAAWVNYKSLPNGFPSIITRNGTLDGALFLVQTGSHAGVQTGSSWTAGTTTLSPNTWYHIAATYDGTTVRLYVNGRQDGAYAYSSPLGSQDPVRVGALYSGSNAFNGTIDDVRIYSRALNSTEIAQIYSNPTNLLYTVSKPDCAYAGGDTQVLQVPFTANQDQNQNAYYYAVVKAWGKGARGAAAVTVCGNAGQVCCSGNICTSGNVCSGSTCVACGTVGQACCSGNTCNVQLTCASGTCQCGGSGQACCSGTTCNSGYVCNASTTTCQACGAIGQSCCSSNTCNVQLTCASGTCQCGGSGQACCSGTTCNSGFVCNATTTTCQACGGSGQPCCTGSACNSGFICNATTTTCQACGATGQPCCAGSACNSGNSCIAGTCQACGTSVGQACCQVSSGSYVGANKCTVDGLGCNYNTHLCMACGGSGQPCCGTTVSCNDSEIVCMSYGSSSGAICICGGVGACNAGYGCSSTYPNSMLCVACGANGQECCAGDTCPSGTAAAPLECRASIYGGGKTCAACGASGQYCCGYTPAYNIYSITPDVECPTNYACGGTATYDQKCWPCGNSGELCCGLRYSSNTTCNSPYTCVVDSYIAGYGAFGKCY